MESMRSISSSMTSSALGLGAAGSAARRDWISFSTIFLPSSRCGSRSWCCKARCSEAGTTSSPAQEPTALLSAYSRRQGKNASYQNAASYLAGATTITFPPGRRSGDSGSRPVGTRVAAARKLSPDRELQARQCERVAVLVDRPAAEDGLQRLVRQRLAHVGLSCRSLRVRARATRFRRRPSSARARSTRAGRRRR